MRYQISGKQIDIGTALQTHVESELGDILGKYSGRPTDANVVFSKSGHEYVQPPISSHQQTSRKRPKTNL